MDLVGFLLERNDVFPVRDQPGNLAVCVVLGAHSSGNNILQYFHVFHYVKYSHGSSFF